MCALHLTDSRAPALTRKERRQKKESEPISPRGPYQLRRRDRRRLGTPGTVDTIQLTTSYLTRTRPGGSGSVA